MFRIQFEVLAKNNLISKQEVQNLIDSLDFFIVKPVSAKVTKREGFTVVTIGMSNGDKINYELVEKKDRKIFHFGDFHDETFPYTENPGKEGTLNGYIRMYPYYIEKKYNINGGYYRTSTLTNDFNQFIQKDLFKRYKEKLNVFEDERTV